MEDREALRKGLGRGYLAAARGNEGCDEAILEHILKDPRWDSRTDQRAGYYAQLFLLRSLPFTRIQACLQLFAETPQLEHRERSHLLETVAQMAARGHTLAQESLRRCSAQPWLVEDIRWALYTTGGTRLLGDILGPGQLGWIDETVEEPLPDPVNSQSSDAELLAQLENNSPRARELVSERATVAELLQHRHRCGLLGYLKIMQLLGQKGCAELIGEATQALSGDHITPQRKRAYLAYLSHLPGHISLPHARRWLSHDKLRSAALAILSRHAQSCDRALVEEALLKSVGQGDYQALPHLIAAVDRLRDSDSTEVLMHCWEQVEASCLRARILQALGHHRRQSNVQQLLIEGLWDCEASTREYACAGVWAPRRLKDLCADPWEVAAVRSAAGATLTAGAPLSLN